jgi:hypothetical protein
MLLDKDDLRPDPNNTDWTIPKSYGVWEVKPAGNSKSYRYGNNPVREIELSRDFEKVTCLGLFSERSEAIEHAARLNTRA